jgi:hypothetical protein
VRDEGEEARGSARGEGCAGRTRGGAAAALSLRTHLALELLHKVVDGAVVKVLATEVGVTSHSLHLDDALLEGEERDVKGAAAEVKDQDVALRQRLLVEAVRDRRRGRLGDNTEHA